MRDRYERERTRQQLPMVYIIRIRECTWRRIFRRSELYVKRDEGLNASCRVSVWILVTLVRIGNTVHT